MNKEYILIVDTEEYAGNFEREMCAYMTGKIGDCEVGREEQKVFYEDINKDVAEWFDTNVGEFQDSHGVYRPVRLSPTPGWFSDGVGNYYKELDYNPQNVIEQYNKTQAEYKKKFPTSSSVGFINSGSDIVKYPAYLSFEILFYEQPSDDLINLMAQRAYNAHKDVQRMPKTVTAVRLIERTTTVQDVELVRK